jgi:hypothetical protein
VVEVITALGRDFELEATDQTTDQIDGPWLRVRWLAGLRVDPQALLVSRLHRLHFCAPLSLWLPAFCVIWEGASGQKAANCEEFLTPLTGRLLEHLGRPTRACFVRDRQPAQSAFLIVARVNRQSAANGRAA